LRTALSDATSTNSWSNSASSVCNAFNFFSKASVPSPEPSLSLNRSFLEDVWSPARVWTIEGMKEINKGAFNVQTFNLDCVATIPRFLLSLRTLDIGHGSCYHKQEGITI
jgi:hypothetical protein